MAKTRNGFPIRFQEDTSFEITDADLGEILLLGALAGGEKGPIEKGLDVGCSKTNRECGNQVCYNAYCSNSTCVQLAC